MSNKECRNLKSRPPHFEFRHSLFDIRYSKASLIANEPCLIQPFDHPAAQSKSSPTAERRSKLLRTGWLQSSWHGNSAQTPSRSTFS
jgi:hypothetical protein